MVILEFSTRSGTHIVSPSKGTKATPVILSGCRVITHENKAIHSLVLQLLRNTPYSLKINVFLTYLLIIISGRAGGVGRGSVVPLNTNMAGQSPSRLVRKNTFTEVLHNTCDISDLKAHIFSPQTTQELPKKHHEAGPPKQLTTDTLDTVRIAKRFAFWKFWERVCVWLSGRWVPPHPPPPPLTFQNAPPSLLMNMIIISTATIISLFKLLPITYLRIHLIILLTYVY